MSNFKINSLNNFVVHFVGNKGKGDGLIFSENQENFIDIDKQIISLVNKSFSLEDKFQFTFAVDLELNPIYSFVKKIFQDENEFHSQTVNISRFLYDQSTHASIQAGELCFGYLNDLIYDGKKTKGLILFKSEKKDKILNVKNNNNGLFLELVSGINLNKIEKGCLIIDLENQSGFVVHLVHDLINTNVKYWNEDFLHIRQLSNNYSKTKLYLNAVKNVIEELYPTDKVLEVKNLNKVLNYFESNSIFNENQFAKCFDSIDMQDALLKRTKNILNGSNVEFEISKNALIKQKKSFRKKLKLDNNFDILVYDNDHLMEKGVDSKGKFYKFYYENE